MAAKVSTKAKSVFESSFQKQSFDDHAVVYDRVMTQITRRWAEESMKLTSGAIKQRLNECVSTNKPFTFLDVGAGTGTLTFELIATHFADSPPPLKIIATDSSSAMLSIMKHNLENGPYKNLALSVEYISMDGQKLDKIENESVDVIGSNFAMAFFPNADETWKNAYRVLKTGGMMFSTIWDNASSNFNWVNGMNAVVNENVPYEQQQPKARLDWKLSLEKMQQLGFQNLVAHHSSHSLYIADREEMIEGVLDSPIAKKAVEVLGMKRAREEVSKLFEKSARDGMYRLDDNYASGPMSISLYAHILFASKT